MTIRAVNRRLAALGHARQLRVSARADRAANAVDRAVGRVWRKVLLLIKDAPAWPFAEHKARLLFADVIRAAALSVHGSLDRTAAWAWRAAAADLKRSVPAKLLAKALARKVTHERYALGGPGHDALGPGNLGSVAEGLEAGTIRLREDGSDQPGWELTIADLFKLLGLTPPAAADTGPAAAPGAIDYGRLSALLFPAPTPDEIARVIYSSGWQDRLAAASRLAPPAQMASILASGLAAGKTQQQIARDLLPAVEGVRASARRMARTEALRVAGQMQMAAHEALGDLVIGYRAHAVIDEHSRPWHAARSGTVYYKEPGPGQKGLDKMPRPPDEPPDPSERPPGTPQTAWNCRCTLFPVLREPGG